MLAVLDYVRMIPITYLKIHVTIEPIAIKTKFIMYIYTRFVHPRIQKLKLFKISKKNPDDLSMLF